MKLYYSPGACSLSPHIILNEGGFSFDRERVDLASKKTETGADYAAINPDGYVPALLLDDGQVLTEGPAIIQYLADRVPEKKLAPPLGTLERYRLMQWLNFISTELHKGFSPLFHPQAPKEWKTVVAAQLGRRLSTVSRQLEGKDWLLGEGFTVADAYLFTVLGWGRHVGIDVEQWPVLQAYQGRVSTRPAVQSALKAEGLLQDT
ncbi:MULTISPECIES: glutathione transferase GstA [Acidithiobacillus]|jgi:glutathione S-transferase|uniref:Glutathione S-transferase n=2 Tax=Acidithiobacillus ferrooxidans TaxID=920 RepID=B7J7R1_ACIF2|nr:MULTISPECIES: glutathione transferase GstA [Acidithiobacillus]MCL5956889.1 glutathione transferase GstA [Gammaproteobacteria bacterium]ACH84426.1 Glutathione S-transferase domain [Acidithiobacillus ferrooxidans ATCC 53993]ACK78121.1 glutathione S-transferase [Acidithiobacillus ferrooxidans ATCC 23270]MBN6745818.1 glutathione transferase GstA [Acidithiobacillus sp. MC2.2]MBN6748739.1 glutathione transferase GstA [Acidithiobacillus sp. PG05]